MQGKHILITLAEAVIDCRRQTATHKVILQ